MVRLDYADTRYCTAGFSESPWMQEAEASCQQERAIRLSVAYREERPRADEGPFLKEERALLNAILQRLVDVINRRHAARALKEQEQLIVTMFSQTTDAIVLVDTRTGRFVDFNDAAHRALGYTREEYSRLSIIDIQAEHTAEQIVANTDKTAAGLPIGFETLHRHKDGSLRTVAMTLRPLSLQGKSAHLRGMAGHHRSKGQGTGAEDFCRADPAAQQAAWAAEHGRTRHERRRGGLCRHDDGTPVHIP